MTNTRKAIYIILVLGFLAMWFMATDMLDKRSPSRVFSKDHQSALIYRHMKDSDEKQYKEFTRIKCIFETKKGVAEDGVTLYYIPREDLLAKVESNSLSRDDFTAVKMASTKNNVGDYFIATIPSRPRPKKYYHFIEAKDKAGNVLQLPEDPIKNYKELYRTTYKTPLRKYKTSLIIHIITMVFAFTLWIHSFYYAILYLVSRSLAAVKKCFASAFWGNVIFAISGFPLGWYVAYKTFGVAWSGWPLGNDITDTKTLVTFAYWTLILVLMPAFLFKNDQKKNYLSNGLFSVLSIIGGILTVVVFVFIEHSL